MTRLKPMRTFDSWTSPLKVLRCRDIQQGHAPMRRRYLMLQSLLALRLCRSRRSPSRLIPRSRRRFTRRCGRFRPSPVPMLAYVIRPIGGGPFPLVVMNHGVSLDATGRSYFPIIEFRDAALWFARQGYVVVAPVRPGYGATAIEIPERGLFGVFFSGVGKCSDAEFREAGLAVGSIDKWSSTTCQLSHLSSAMTSSLSANPGVVGVRLR